MKKDGVVKILSVISILVSGVCWGVISLFIKPLSAAGLSAMQVCCIRLLIAAPVFVIATLCVSPSLFRFRLKDIWMFIGTGVVSIFLFNVFYFYTIIQSEASVAVVLLYTSPIFVMIFSVLLFKEKIGVKKLVALVLTFVGCLFVSGVIGTGAKLRPMIALTGLLSGLFYALYSIFGKIALKKYDALTVTTYTFLFAFVFAIPFSGMGKMVSVLSASPKLLWYGAGIALLSTALPYFLYTWGLKKLEPARAAILSAVEPIVGSIIGIAVFGEGRSVLKLVGIVLVLGAIIILNVPKRTRVSIPEPLPVPERSAQTNVPASVREQEPLASCKK